MSSLLNTYRAEYLKLRSTASLWWTSAVFLFLGLIVPVGFGATTAANPTGMEGYEAMVTPDLLLGGLVVACLPVVVVQAAMTVSTEYRFGGQALTLLATPSRIVVAVAKWLAYAVHIAVLTLLVVLVAYAVGGALIPGLTPTSFFEDGHALTFLWTTPLSMVLLTTLTQGIALMVRNTAGAVVLVLAWMMVLEGAVSMLPKIGAKVAEYLPFQHFQAFLGQIPAGDWGVMHSGLYFALWAVGIWGLGFALFARRDA
ncbi:MULTISPECIES: multidrug ABC transporter permease [unclassified Corynebacterium]|uniref:multidrug ABC transporter permease n=1 Tax=unclassified Corynebacterium TaxID=2624378 RepID=UPI0029CA51E1|nr:MULTISPECIES: multidrug ABC transporter permease [unclassified Corynebacterium]WPF65897.1 multidrug ABC transporter permease [Corynebacterium sp. 22KM0430]WPF68390.1 multidrug ABC transporter permease [Corynebacterium sp. 21KM1197]